MTGSPQQGRLGWVIVYVERVSEAVELYEQAFGLRRAFIDDSGRYGQLDTGQTALAFVAESLAAENLPGGYRRADPLDPPVNIELCLVFDDVAAAYQHAVACGCVPVADAKPKPWGQVVAYVRDPFGTLVELASPMP